MNSTITTTPKLEKVALDRGPTSYKNIVRAALQILITLLTSPEIQQLWFNLYDTSSKTTTSLWFSGRIGGRVVSEQPGSLVCMTADLLLAASASCLHIFLSQWFLALFPNTNPRGSVSMSQRFAGAPMPRHVHGNAIPMGIPWETPMERDGTGINCYGMGMGQINMSHGQLCRCLIDK